MTTFDLAAIHLDKGAHSSRDQGACLLEVVSMLAKEPFTDHPKCVSPVLQAYGIALNDRWDDVQRQKLKRFIPLLVGTAGDGQDEGRSYLALDWLIRTFTPAWLDLAGLTVEAGELRGLRCIVGIAAAGDAGPVLRNAGSKADAARVAARVAAGDAAGDAAWDAARVAAWDAARVAVWDAAGDAVWDAAGDAAWDAARVAARVAAWDAAWDAARDAAGDAARDAAWVAARVAAGDAAGDAAWDAARVAARVAARDAAWVAARDALQPTVEILQASALELFDSMIDPSAAKS